MPEEIINEGPQFRLKYALLTEEQYNNLNAAISAAKGYSVEKATQRYAPTLPQMSASILDEDEIEISPSLCVMPITANVQELFPDTIEGVELVDSYEPAIEPEN